MRQRAYTLVEVLAVTVLLGLLAGLGAPPLLRSLAGDPLARAAGRLALAFRDTRAQAYGQRLGIALEAGGFAIAAADGRERATLPGTRLPEAIQATWTRNGRPLHLLELDPRGHALDTEVTLRQDDRELSFTIDGLTGAWLGRAAR